MRIWMEEHYGEKDHFALKITLYLLLLLAFAIMMPVGVTWLAVYYGKNVPLFRRNGYRKSGAMIP